MSAGVPFDWLHTVAQAWPLRAPAAFDAADATLDDRVRDRLWASLEGWARPRAAGMSLDSLQRLARSAWEMPGDGHTLAGYVGRLAAGALAWAGDGVGLALDSARVAAPDAVLARWRWLSLALPPDLLIAAVAARAGRDPGTDTVTITDRALSRAFGERPFAVTHLHIGAAVPFVTLWSGVMRSVATDGYHAMPLDRGGPPPFGDAAAFRARLLQAALARVVLGGFLWRREVDGAHAAARLGEFLRDDGPPAAGLRGLCARVPWAYGPAHAAHVLRDAVRDLARPAAQPAERREWHALYKRIVGPQARARSLAAVLAGDPLAAWLRPTAGAASAETRFAARALRHLRHAPDDDAFARLFWQYQRVRTMTYVHLVEERGTAGLDWFSRHYQRISPLRAACDHLLFEAAILTESRGLALQSLEGRTSPPDEWHAVRDELRRIARDAAAAPALDAPGPAVPRAEIGLVYHFTKEHVFQAAGRTWRHADPRQPRYGCRFGRWYAQRERQAAAMVRALHQHPELLLVLRAIDVANVELAVPTWAVAPLFRRVRRASRAAAAACATRHHAWRVEPLRATWHAGEDFTRLVQGLRMIHEPVEAGAIGAADRIGHAVALGLDVDRWCAAGPVAQSVEERLDDLLWEWERYAAGDVEPAGGRVLRIEREVERLAAHMFGAAHGGVDVATVARARRLRLIPGVLELLGYPYLRGGAAPRRRDDGYLDDADRAADAEGSLGGEREGAWRLLHAYLRDAGAHLRGRETLAVHAGDDERRFLHGAQRWLARRLDALAITVETNPTSNLLIGDFASLDQHPAFRLQPLRVDDAAALRVPISINSDNPLTFATSLADEFTYMYAGLRRHGVDAVSALEWLDRVRESGWRARFTLAASADPDALWTVARDARRVARVPSVRRRRR